MHLSHLAAALGFLALEASALPKIYGVGLPLNPAQVSKATGSDACCSALHTLGQQNPILANAFCSNFARPVPADSATTTTAVELPANATASATVKRNAPVYTLDWERLPDEPYITPSTATTPYYAITTTTAAATTTTPCDDDTPTSTSTDFSSTTIIPPYTPKKPTTTAPPPPPPTPASSLDQCMQIDIESACHCLMMAEYQPEAQPEEIIQDIERGAFP